MSWVVKLENTSKRYRTGGAHYAALRDDLAQLGRKITSVFRKNLDQPKTRPALDDVSFEVQEGEAFAIIGSNGAGKTTALKLVSRICYPTAGRVRVRGRVGALIEVGSGIHPELSGRENIWLYGRIMGMSRQEIGRRFDQIVEFAELSHALEMPVKMYSTGMQLRLGFAIASHLDPDIFVVDEALAVGDAGFQAKCVERMMHLVGEGRTLLFVSHNLHAVESLCPNGLFLQNGRVVTTGKVRDVLRQYLEWTERQALERWHNRSFTLDSGLLEIVAASCHGSDGAEKYEFTSDEPMEIRVRFRARQAIRSPHVNLGITDGRPGMLIHCSTLHRGEPPEYVDHDWTASCHIERLSLMPRLYKVWCDVHTEYGHGVYSKWQEVTAFRIFGSETTDTLNGKQAVTIEALGGAVKTDYRWKHTTANGNQGRIQNSSSNAEVSELVASE